MGTGNDSVAGDKRVRRNDGVTGRGCSQGGAAGAKDNTAMEVEPEMGNS